VTTLLVEAAVGSRFNVNPVLLGVGHAPTAGNLVCRSGFVERAGTRAVAECFGSVAALTRIPLINNHLDRHLESPNAARALLLVGLCRKSPMTAFPVNQKRRWNPVPGRWQGLFLSLTSPDFQLPPPQFHSAPDRNGRSEFANGDSGRELRERQARDRWIFRGPRGITQLWVGGVGARLRGRRVYRQRWP